MLYDVKIELEDLYTTDEKKEIRGTMTLTGVEAESRDHAAEVASQLLARMMKAVAQVKPSKTANGGAT